MALTQEPGVAELRSRYSTVYRTRLIRFTRRDGSFRRYTTWDAPIEFEGDSYLPIGGVSGEDYRSEAGANVENFGFTAPLDGEEWMTEELRTHMWAEAIVEVIDVDARWPFQGVFRSRWGVVQDVKFSGSRVSFDAKSITDALNRKVGAVTSRRCRYVLGVNTGHSFCDANVVGAGKWTGTILASAGFSGSNKRRVFRVELIDGFGQKPNKWYRNGDLKWLTGNNANIVADPVVTPVDGISRFIVKRYTNIVSSSPGFYVDQIELQDDCHLDAVIGDTFEVTPGCLHRFGKDCGKDKFDRQESFGGEPHQPGAAKVINGKIK